MKRIFSWTLAAALCFSACSMPGLRGALAEEASQQPYRLRVGDGLEISAGPRSDSVSVVKVPVDEDGTISYPGLEPVQAAGRSIRELESEIEKQFAIQSAIQSAPAETSGSPSSSSSSQTFSPAEVFSQIYQLQVGDQLDFSVWEHPELSQKIQVREDGTFPFPLIGSVQAAGRTTSDLEKEIRERLDKDFIVNPQVSVRLIGAQFTVLGQKGSSGTYPIEGSLDLMTALGKAGDILTLRTSPVEIIRRQGNKQVVIRANVDRLLNGKDPNIPVLPRDTIYVKPPLVTASATASDSDPAFGRKISVRIIGAKFTALGEVNSPGVYSIDGALDVLGAVSLAGGISKFGSSRIEVIRTVGAQKVVIRANLDRILQGKDPNFRIFPHDTIHAKRRLF